MTTLTARRQQLIDKFHQRPRVYDDAEWSDLYRAFESAGRLAGASEIAQRMDNFRHILRTEFTPMTPEETEPWQLRKDVE